MPNDDLVSPEEEAYYQECKKYYDITGMPLVSISDEILNSTPELSSVSLKLVIDENMDNFDTQKFLKNTCLLLNISSSDVELMKIQRGCVVVELAFWKEVNAKQKKIKIKALYNSLTDRIREELGKIKVFFMFMGDIVSFQQVQNFRNELKLHPEWNRIYNIGHTYWTGALNDGRDRGDHPYYCPIGWKRYSFYVSDNFDEKFNGWPICYHGTKFAYGLSILLSGLKPAEVIAHGKGIYASPSIIYVCHPRYSEVRKIKPSEEVSFVKSGKYVQFVLQCRVHPKTILKIDDQTLGAANTIIDPNISNDEIEWLIDSRGQDVVDFNDPNAVIICTALMIRITDNHPGLLPESQWWYSAHLCSEDTKNCCLLGMDLDQLKAKVVKGEKCNIIHE